MTDIKRLADLDAETNALCGQVSHDEARAILSRFVNSHFKNPGEHARASIPADPKRDDDLRLAAYIAQRRDRERDLLAAALLLAKEVRARRLLDDTPELDVDTKFGSPEQIRWSLASNAFLAARAAVESNPLANAMIEEARAATDAKNKEQAMIDDILSLPHAAIAERVWQGTSWSYPNIERLIVELTSLRARVAELEAQHEDMDRQRCAAMAAAHAARRIGEQAADALIKCRDAMTREAWQEGASIAEAEAAAAGAIANVEAFSDTDWNLKIRALLDRVAKLGAAGREILAFAEEMALYLEHDYGVPNSTLETMEATGVLPAEIVAARAVFNPKN